MKSESRHMLITGGTGYIGGQLTVMALTQGWQVTLLGRKTAPDVEHDSNMRCIPWSLEKSIPTEAFSLAAGFSPVNAVVHLAHSWNPSTASDRDPNKFGLQQLLAASRKAGVPRFVFGSTMSARSDASNIYGKSKWNAEQTLHRPGEVSARMGLVYGGPMQSLWGTLCKLVQITSVIPLPELYRCVQPIHVDEVCEGLIALSKPDREVRPVYYLAGDKPIPFGTFLKTLARARFGRSIHLIPIPLTPLLWIMNIANLFRLPIAIYRERLLGLAGITTRDSADDLIELQLTVRPLAEGLSVRKTNTRYLLLTEGFTLLRYILGTPPRLGHLKRYVRAIEGLENMEPLKLPGLTKRFPPLLAIFDPIKPSSVAEEEISLFKTRLHIASLVLDASSAQTALAYDYKGRGPARAVWRLVQTGLVEVVIMPLRLLFGKII